MSNAVNVIQLTLLGSGASKAVIGAGAGAGAVGGGAGAAAGDVFQQVTSGGGSSIDLGSVGDAAGKGALLGALGGGVKGKLIGNSIGKSMGDPKAVPMFSGYAPGIVSPASAAGSTVTAMGTVASSIVENE